MTRLAWSEAGAHHFEAGVDRGVLYIDNQPGVAWTGLIAVRDNRSGGAPKPRFIDGVMVSNHAGPERFQGTIEAYTYPTEFEVCNGTSDYQNGLRVNRQRRRQFHMCYRTKVGNDVAGLEHAYRLHILYNLRAEPAERGFQTLSDSLEPMTFSWDVTARPEVLPGLIPTAYFELDSRNVPAELLTTLEDILYGDATHDASLPSAGELLFLFDSYDDLVYDAGDAFTPTFSIHDAGSPSTPVTSTIDSGGV